MVIGGDAWEPSQLLKKSLTVGLLAGGAEVLDIGETIAPAVRVGIPGLGAEGGIFVHSCSSNYGYSAIRFFDREGLNLLHGKERKLEQIFLRDDFPRARKDKLGVNKTIEDFNEITGAWFLTAYHRVDKRSKFINSDGFPPPHLQKS